jgi:hypothetical protein
MRQRQRQAVPDGGRRCAFDQADQDNDRSATAADVSKFALASRFSDVMRLGCHKNSLKVEIHLQSSPRYISAQR